MTHAGHAALLTQCPHCETVFRLNASLLAVARGFVERGNLGAVESHGAGDGPEQRALP